jgi:hypothetical protein
MITKRMTILNSLAAISSVLVIHSVLEDPNGGLVAGECLARPSAR